jgi:hypothetical protein
MRYIQRAIAFSGLLVLLTFSSAFGQSDRQTIIHIPFNFTVGEKSFPSGKYVIERNGNNSDTVWVITNKETDRSAIVVTRSARANDVVEETRLVFNRYDDLYFLSEFWIVGGQNGHEVPASSREKALEKAVAVKRTELLIDRGK